VERTLAAVLGLSWILAAAIVEYRHKSIAFIFFLVLLFGVLNLLIWFPEELSRFERVGTPPHWIRWTGWAFLVFGPPVFVWWIYN